MNAIISGRYEYTDKPVFEMSASINNASSTTRIIALLSRLAILNSDSTVGTPINEKLTISENNNTTTNGNKLNATFGVKLLNENLIRLYPEFTTFTIKDLVFYDGTDYVTTIGSFIWSQLATYLQDLGGTVNKTNFAFVSAVCNLHN